MLKQTEVLGDNPRRYRIEEQEFEVVWHGGMGLPLTAPRPSKPTELFDYVPPKRLYHKKSETWEKRARQARERAEASTHTTVTPNQQEAHDVRNDHEV